MIWEGYDVDAVDANTDAIRDLWDNGTGLVPVVHEHTDGTVIRLLTDHTGRVVASFPDLPGMDRAFTAFTEAPRLLIWLYGLKVWEWNGQRHLLAERDSVQTENARLWASVSQCPHGHDDLDQSPPTGQEPSQ